MQDCGTGAFLFWPLRYLGKDFDDSWSDRPLFRVLVTRAILLFIAWAIRYVTSSDRRLPNHG